MDFASILKNEISSRRKDDRKRVRRGEVGGERPLEEESKRQRREQSHESEVESTITPQVQSPTEDSELENESPKKKDKKDEDDADVTVGDQVWDEIDFNINIDDIKAEKTKVEHQIHSWIQHCLREWRQSLDSAPAKFVEAGLDDANLRQCISYLHPLLFIIQRDSLSMHIYPLLARLVAYAQQHKYTKAADDYLKLSIGSQTWPLGLAILRPSGEVQQSDKFFDTKITTMLADDTTRRWLGSVKRLLTFAETKWPR